MAKTALDRYLTAEEIDWITEIKSDRKALRANLKNLDPSKREAARAELENLSNGCLAEKFEVPAWVIEKV